MSNPFALPGVGMNAAPQPDPVQGSSQSELLQELVRLTQQNAQLLQQLTARVNTLAQATAAMAQQRQALVPAPHNARFQDYDAPRGPTLLDVMAAGLGLLQQWGQYRQGRVEVRGDSLKPN